MLKEEWGKKMLRLHSVVTREHTELLESAYRDKVMSWVKKMVAKQQMRDLARIQAESVSFFKRKVCRPFLREIFSGYYTVFYTI